MKDDAVYLTFDDGPHPLITPWVLDLLMEYNVKATFFCIGKNVANHPEVYQRILQEGHSVGNHTYTHMNGWKAEPLAYLKDVEEAEGLINSSLFRPPYGRIKNAQAKLLLKKKKKIVMWDVLSADFDASFSPEQCFKNVIQHTSKGSVIVFHDSEKAFDNLKIVLPKTLEWLRAQQYICSHLYM
jgi:peptidoglycan/xylan/chitin deacetylase (PgdA/CDA1 family)